MKSFVILCVGFVFGFLLTLATGVSASTQSYLYRLIDPVNSYNDINVMGDQQNGVLCYSNNRGLSCIKMK